MANFNIKRDNELIASGSHFWCSGHLSAVPVGEQSPDSRYCNFCYELLNNEVKVLKETRQFNRRTAWIPRQQPQPAPQRHADSANQRDKMPVTVADVETGIHKTQVIMSHRGRNKKSLPVARIKELAATGASSRDIAKQLELDGVSVSYRTVSRSLVGN